MIDKRFYEHREQDPLRHIVAVAVLSLAMFVVACSVGSVVTANVAGCPKWLGGTFKAGSMCFAGPISGPLWVLQYRALVGSKTKAHMATWSPAYRRRFNRALDASVYAMIGGVLIAVVSGILAAVAARKKAMRERPVHKGTRFWATDDEVFSTGLAVNYKPPIGKKIRRWLDS